MDTFRFGSDELWIPLDTGAVLSVEAMSKLLRNKDFKPLSGFSSANEINSKYILIRMKKQS